LHLGRTLVATWAIALLLSHGVRAFRAPEATLAGTDLQAVSVHPLTPAGEGGGRVVVAYADDGPRHAPTVLLLHGSPGSHRELLGVARALRARYRVIVPDLPGFGRSTRDIPDYSIRAHARYMHQLLDSLRVGAAHVVGFSMGGGVALHLADTHPDRVASLVLLSSIGVQEYELLGDYHLNRALHALQLAGLWLLREGTPHFGWLDDAFLGVPYARNFFDTDQRPLRGILERWVGPALILQGERDRLVPPGIAEEHGRVLPQSEVVMLPGGHFLTFTDPDVVAAPLAAFLERVESGRATTRATADPDRLHAASQPFDPARIPRPVGFSLLVVLALLAAATLVSEDLACIAGGLLVSRGTLAFFPATLACLIGITLGDLLLFSAGRVLGRPALVRAPLRWFVSAADVERSSAWFRRKGMGLVLTTRFLPGTRLPTYVAAGILRTSVSRFAAAFLLAAMLWTPLLVGAAALFGDRMLTAFGEYGRLAAPAFLATLVGLWVAVRLSTGLATWRGRRLLLSRWRRLTRWEFWPLWAFYAPVVLYILWLGLRHRSLTVFTAANPVIPAGGLVGESKYDILRGLASAWDRVAPTVRMAAEGPLEDRVREVDRFAEAHGGYPIVLKPDVGERGSGVSFAMTPAEVERYLSAAADPVLAQAYIPGEEFGLFYYRIPGNAAGHLFAITEKHFPVVVGDGRRTLEDLILADDRAVCLAGRFLAAHGPRLAQVPGPGELVVLTELGTHSRGATFHDGARYLTPALERSVDELTRPFEGFWFGRYDVRAPSAEALMAGGPFTVLELNGVSSEATSIYDPAHGLLHAYRTLFAQWRLAFAIGEANRARGARPASVGEIIRLLRRHWQVTRRHVT
jgi:pimeloyl-ACP methyl ester carboxylesterase/membrane protein DedA with SNARE-associated domain